MMSLTRSSGLIRSRSVPGTLSVQICMSLLSRLGIRRGLASGTACRAGFKFKFKFQVAGQSEPVAQHCDLVSDSDGNQIGLQLSSSQVA
jgi:hypothetical protein